MEFSFCLLWNNLTRCFMKNKQYYVKITDREALIRLLCDARGYKNRFGITPDSFPLTPPVIVVDVGKREIGPTNVTCLAAMASCGKRPCAADEFFEKPDIFLSKDWKRRLRQVRHHLRLRSCTENRVSVDRVEFWKNKFILNGRRNYRRSSLFKRWFFSTIFICKNKNRISHIKKSQKNYYKNIDKLCRMVYNIVTK